MHLFVGGNEIRTQKACMHEETRNLTYVIIDSMYVGPKIIIKRSKKRGADISKEKNYHNY